ncbi:competence protein ComK [Lentibacillus sp. Marseille-P4043]|uniref:competence protein ComK n=1 Tax=Lentibacillus sp. Marseille-P4043 TaxID=2040293 RepID=UPI000D0B8AAE|nr:competence protein ComK [Lentibacillus sp. Marseille-P4043]
MGVADSLIYEITQQTKAIMRKDSAYYRARILEAGQTKDKLCIHKPEKILQNSCLINGSSLLGRRTAVKQILKTRSKLPIPVIPEKDVFMLPTASTKSKDCVWLSFYHIEYYEQRDNRTYVSFYDGSGIYVNSSENTIDMQIKKASQVITKMNRPSTFG